MFSLYFYFFISTTISSSSIGKSRKKWSEISNRQKRRKIEALRETQSDELLYAAKSKAYVENNIDLAKILDYLEKYPTCIKKVREFCENTCTVPLKQISRDKALSMFISLNLSKSKYISLREISAEESLNIFTLLIIKYNLQKKNVILQNLVSLLQTL